MRKQLFAIMLIMSCGALAQTQVERYRPGVTPEGAVYYLPRTALRITVQVEKSVYTPGDFCKYAERYLSLNNIEGEQATRYKVNSIRISSFGVPDTSKCFSVKYNVKTSASNIQLSDDGILLAINDNAEKIASEKPFVSGRKPTLLNPRDYMTEDILAAGSTAKMAELTAHEIYDIRDSKNQLTRGQADNMPKDGEQLRIMLHNLDMQEAALTQLFTGTTIKDTTESAITFIPSKETSREVLFRLSNLIGMTDADDLSGAPYYISIEDQHSLPPVDNSEAAKKAKKAEGMTVNVPGKISVKVFNNDKTFASSEFSAAQFGRCDILGSKLFDKKSTTHVLLNPATGAVEKLQAEEPK